MKSLSDQARRNIASWGSYAGLTFDNSLRPLGSGRGLLFNYFFILYCGSLFIVIVMVSTHLLCSPPLAQLLSIKP